MIIGALIIKHKCRLSDVDTIQAIRENPYMQYMLGLTEYTDKPIFDPSLFVTIRKRITIEDINALTLALARKSEAKKKKKDDDDEPDKTHHTDIKVDATCADTVQERHPYMQGPHRQHLPATCQANSEGQGRSAD